MSLGCIETLPAFARRTDEYVRPYNRTLHNQIL